MIKRSIQYIPLLPIILLAFYPLITNYKYNNHSKNWLNHDYGKNLLSSTEEYSVFMTEGGDNQVFSSLYFTYAEKLRQDIFPYDQKGNIFKRIYGDLRYTSIDILEQRQQHVDQGLFTGQEPFYEQIRGSGLPYLVPYALGKPSTYLTWKRPNHHKLGEFYYKNYGQMYKVQDIRYAIVDYLEMISAASREQVKRHVTEVLGTPVSEEKFSNWVQSLIKDGYINGTSTLNFVKMYPKPFDKDPQDNFIIRWDDIDNIQYYDYLSREIVNSFSYENIMKLGDKIENAQNLLKNEKRQSIIEQLNKEIEEAWKQIEYYEGFLEKTGYDSIGILHNLGIFYFNAQKRFDLKEDRLDKAIAVWEKVASRFPYSWSTHQLLLWAYIQLIISGSENSQEYLQRFDYYVNKMINATKHWKSMKDPKKAQPLKEIADLIRTRRELDSYIGDSFTKLEKNILNKLSNDQTIELTEASNYLEVSIKKMNYMPSIDDLMESLNTWFDLYHMFKEDAKFFTWHTRMLSEFSVNYDLSGEYLVDDTLKDGISIVKNMQGLQARFDTLQYLFSVARSNNKTEATSFYAKEILKIAKGSMNEQSYQQLHQELSKYII